MEKKPFNRVKIKKEAKNIVLKHYLAAIVPFILAALGGVFANQDWTILAAIYSIVVSLLILKYSLALVRNPDRVQSNILDTLRYSLVDNFWTRLIYMIILSVIVFIINMGVFLAVTTMGGLSFIFGMSLFRADLDFMFLLTFFAVLVFLFFIYLINIYFYFYSYIIQDNLSEGNRLPKLTVLETLSKSFELMRGRVGEFILLHLSMLGWALSCVLIIPIFFVVPYMSTVTTIWINKVMAEDDEIVDFG